MATNRIDYHGQARSRQAPTVTRNGQPLAERRELMDYGNEITWGHRCPGAQQLALALLADALQDDQRALDLCGPFMHEVTSKLHVYRWHRNSDDIRAWFTNHKARSARRQTWEQACLQFAMEHEGEHSRVIIHDRLIVLAVVKYMPQLGLDSDQVGIWGYRLQLHHSNGQQELFTFSNIGNVIAHDFPPGRQS